MVVIQPWFQWVHIQNSSPKPFFLASGEEASQVCTWTGPDAPNFALLDLCEPAKVATVFIEAVCLVSRSADKKADFKTYSIFFFLSSSDGRRQEIQLKRRGSDSKLLTQLLAQLPSSTEWEEGTFCASPYHHPQHSVGMSEKVLLLASKHNPKEGPYRGLPLLKGF